MKTTNVFRQKIVFGQFKGIWTKKMIFGEFKGIWAKNDSWQIQRYSGKN